MIGFNSFTPLELNKSRKICDIYPITNPLQNKTYKYLQSSGKELDEKCIITIMHNKKIG